MDEDSADMSVKKTDYRRGVKVESCVRRREKDEGETFAGEHESKRMRVNVTASTGATLIHPDEEKKKGESCGHDHGHVEKASTGATLIHSEEVERKRERPLATVGGKLQIVWLAQVLH